uniref:Transposase n=1 Tax=Cyprinus carpio carpio TaxID=630221 RepID=A0A9J7XRB0_CYPCA
MAAGRCERICTHSEAKTFGRWPGVKKGSKEATSLHIRDRLIFCRKYSEWTAEDWGKVIFSDEAPFRLFGASGKRLVQRRKGERYHQSCVMPTVKHPDTIHVWGCFSSKGVGSLTILPKNTAMNPKVFASLCVQMRSHLPAAIPEQALHWWHSDPATESSLGDDPGACWTFLDALKPSLQELNLFP